MPAPCSCEGRPLSQFGWLRLRRRRGGPIAGYKRRFAALRGSHLHLYEDVQRTKEKGYIDLAMATVHHKEAAAASTQVFFVEGPYTGRNYEFRAETKRDLLAWVATITEAAWHRSALPNAGVASSPSRLQLQVSGEKEGAKEASAGKEEEEEGERNEKKRLQGRAESAPSAVLEGLGEAGRMRKKCVSWRDSV